jgi:hypothetical protein
MVTVADIKGGGLIPLLQQACGQMPRDPEFGKIFALLRMNPNYSIHARFLIESAGAPPQSQRIGTFTLTGFIPYEAGTHDLDVVTPLHKSDLPTERECRSLSLETIAIMVRSYCDATMPGASFSKDYEYVGAEPVQEAGFEEVRGHLTGWEDLTFGAFSKSYSYSVEFVACCPAKTESDMPTLFAPVLVDVCCDAIYPKLTDPT